MNGETQQATCAGCRFDIGALVFAMVFPSVVTFVYFQLLQGTESTWQQVAYAIGKTLQFGFPLAWVWCCHRQRLQVLGKPSPLTAAETMANKKLRWLAVAFGGLVVVIMVAVYYGLIVGTVAGDNLTQMAKEKVDSMGLNTLWKYVAVGCFYTVVHSFMEEYYWRWFVYDLGKKYFSVVMSNAVSSLGFAAHHVILLGFFFGWASPWTYLISLAIAVGGVVWAWMYETTGGLRAAWISHAIVDAGIFGLGYFISN